MLIDESAHAAERRQYGAASRRGRAGGREGPNCKAREAGRSGAAGAGGQVRGRQQKVEKIRKPVTLWLCARLALASRERERERDHLQSNTAATSSSSSPWWLLLRWLCLLRLVLSFFIQSSLAVLDNKRRTSARSLSLSRSLAHAPSHILSIARSIRSVSRLCSECSRSRATCRRLAQQPQPSSSTRGSPLAPSSISLEHQVSLFPERSVDSADSLSPATSAATAVQISPRSIVTAATAQRERRRRTQRLRDLRLSLARWLARSIDRSLSNRMQTKMPGSPGNRLVIAASATALLTILLSASWGYACNEAICASVVSKCMLTQSCKCDLVTCTCCKECFSCLSYLYDECCSCVDLCPKPNVTDNPLSKKSHVEDFNEPVPGLFQALTAEPDAHERWLTFTYPVDFDISLFSPKQDKEIKYHMLSDNPESEKSHPLKPNVMTVNCTVAYMAHCNSWNKCRQACQSMGATSYRWFHDGCCECVGDTCINYGINESRCLHCPVDKEEDLKDQYDDYGQDDELTEDEVD